MCFNCLVIPNVRNYIRSEIFLDMSPRDVTIDKNKCEVGVNELVLYAQEHRA